MSTIVGDIHTKILSLTATELGVSWSKMRRVFEPERNDLRATFMSYGVVHGAASDADGVTGVYTFDHNFRVKLLTTIVDRTNDDAIQTSINDLYDNIDNLIKKFVSTKLELPTTVLNVDTPGIDEPVILDNKAVLLEFTFNVKYRQAL